MKNNNRGDSFRKNTAVIIVVLIVFGIIIMGASFYYSLADSLNTAQEVMERNISDLKKQCNNYTDFVSADEAKSLIRVSEKAEDLAETLALLKSDEKEAYIESFLEEQRVDCVLVLGGNMKPDGRFDFDEEDYAEWKDVLFGDAFTALLEYPKKIYMERITHNGKTYDVAATSRVGVSGIVFCATLQSKEGLEAYYLPVRNLLATNETSLSGTLYITSGDTIIASNREDGGEKSSENSEIAALDAVKNKGKLAKFQSNGQTYYGGSVKYRDYCIYAFYPSKTIFGNCRGVLMGIFATYSLIAVVVLLLHYRTKTFHYREISKSKTDFLRRMSHDVRTPINVILGMIEIADRNPDNLEITVSCRQKSKHAAEYLLELVDDILTINKADSEGTEKAKDAEAFDLAEEVRKLYEVADNRAKTAGMTLEPPEISGENLPLEGNALYLRQIMMNVITNAVKYSHEGGTIRFSVSELPGKKEEFAEVRFVCEDQGIGMSEEFQMRMFEPFAQEAGNDAPGGEGVGLGLSIVQKLVKDLGGSIRVESKKNVGTRFEIVIPYRYADKPPEKKAENKNTTEENKKDLLRGLTILLVEDNELNMEIAEYMLLDAGARVIKAYDGEEAVKRFEASEPGTIDAVLTDMTMPVMDGIEETRRIRGLDRQDAGSVPIIAMTANLFEEDMKACTDAGMTGFLPKPLNIDQLLETIAQQTSAADTHGRQERNEER